MPANSLRGGGWQHVRGTASGAPIEWRGMVEPCRGSKLQQLRRLERARRTRATAISEALVRA
eukprot:1892761-Pyramimonas_sp.AAC.1